MRLPDIRNIVVTQAFEESDAGGRLVSDEDKRRAEATAGAPLEDGVKPDQQNQFLACRAESLIGQLEGRLGGNQSWLRATDFRVKLALISLLLIGLAVAIGYSTNYFDPEGKINLLRFPVIGIIVWSLIVYLFELVLMFRKHGGDSGLAGLLARLLFPPAVNLERSDNESGVEFRSRSLFTSRWRQLMLPVLGTRLKSVLHCTALVLALAAIGGMYVRGLAKEYKAVWESTFIDSDQLEPILKVVLKPAAFVGGIDLPDAEALEKLNINNTDGENAATWIHLYAITIGLYVVIPRLVLGVFWHLRASRMASVLPFRNVSPDYFEQVLAVSTGDSMGIAIIPYAHKPSDAVIGRMRAHMEHEFQRPVRITWLDHIAFGEEDDADVDIPGHLSPMILYNFASTPERETHLELYRQLKSERDVSLTAYRVLLDCESFDRKADSFNDAEERRQVRFNAWRTLFTAENCRIHVISEHPGAQALDSEETNG